jgi:hypothetical protein
MCGGISLAASGLIVSVLNLGTNQEESSEAATHEFLSIVSVTCRARHSSLERDLVRARVVLSPSRLTSCCTLGRFPWHLCQRRQRECQFLFQQGVAQSPSMDEGLGEPGEGICRLP